MVTTGGEAGFVQRIIEESILVNNRCRYVSDHARCFRICTDEITRFYTSLLGKHSSISIVVESLKSQKVGHILYYPIEMLKGIDR